MPAQGPKLAEPFTRALQARTYGPARQGKRVLFLFLPSIVSNTVAQSNYINWMIKKNYINWSLPAYHANISGPLGFTEIIIWPEAQIF